MHLKKTSRLYNPEANYEIEKRLSNYVIWSRILQRDIFGNTKIYLGGRRIYGGVGRNSPYMKMGDYAYSETHPSLEALSPPSTFAVVTMATLVRYHISVIIFSFFQFYLP